MFCSQFIRLKTNILLHREFLPPGSPLFTQGVCLMYGMFRLFEEEQLSGSFALESYQNNLHKSEGENFVKNFSIQRSGLRLIVCKWDFRNPRISKYKKENGTGKDILNLEKQQNFTQVSKIAILKKMDKAKNLCLSLML